MQIRNQKIYQEARQILISTYGEDAHFREGQYEAIEAVMLYKRVLVVQKTGWGKSLVYFISTLMNRRHQRGMTMVVSPLLVLMDNQMDFARSMGLRCAALNSSVKAQDRAEVMSRLMNDEYDMLFITPETLLKQEVQNKILPQIRIGLFVIDEVHCISDWGHDFRLEYGELGRIVHSFFPNIAVLGTTATASDRVVNDLKEQLGDNVFISRGPLTRESLHIQVLHLENKTDRYAWLLENLPKLPGTGIVYCLTTRDCDRLAGFLNRNGVSARSYYSKDSNCDAENNEAIRLFYENKIKVIVATCKLGMGYDKGDITFVIHFQSPGNIVAWYQQIGRAGRKLKDAYAFLMTGKEDDDIHNYFIETAFPSPQESSSIMTAVENGNGLTLHQIFAEVNLKFGRATNTLKFLEYEGFVRKDNSSSAYYPTPKKFVYKKDYYQKIMDIRWRELEQMHCLAHTKDCLSRFAVNALDDHTAGRCGKCFNCMGKDVFPGLTLSPDLIEKASVYINDSVSVIEPRKKWPGSKNIDHQLKPGICLSRYGDPGYGLLVKNGKYPPPGRQKRFDEALVAKAAAELKELIVQNKIQDITFVPSLRSDLVKNFTWRLAQQTGLRYVDLLEKKEAPMQKAMENSVYQCRNAMESFTAKHVTAPEKVILVDDVVDSRWTFTACGYKLMERGCKEVYPFALADSSNAEE